MRVWFGKLEDVDGAETHRDLTTEVVAFQLSLTSTTIQRMCTRGELDDAYRTHGETGEWRIPQTSVDAWRASKQHPKRSKRLWNKAS